MNMNYKILRGVIHSERKTADKKIYLLQQDEIGSNIWRCSNCKFEFFWNECEDDIKTSGIKFCPHCGNKIEEYVFIKDDEVEE